MRIKLRSTSGTFAILIPSRGRPDALLKTLRAQPFLNRSYVYVCLEEKEWKTYRKVRKEFSKISYITCVNKYRTSQAAREMLRKTAVAKGFDRYVLADDNARYTEQSLKNLVRASFVYPVQPCIVAGAHGTAAHFDKGRIDRTLETHGGLRFYHKRSVIFWVAPHRYFSKFRYQIDRGSQDDMQATFSAFDQGIFTFLVCLDAPYSKKRFEKGGYGTAQDRVRAMGYAILRFAESHPDYMTKVRTTYPWTQIIKIAKEKQGK